MSKGTPESSLSVTVWSQRLSSHISMRDFASFQGARCSQRSRSKSAARSNLRARLGVEKAFVAVEKTRTINKKSMIHNDATPDIEVDPETYEVRADGELLTCTPAEVLPMAQRYFLF